MAGARLPRAPGLAVQACPDLELLEPYAAGTSGEREASRIHTHVSGCARCLETVEELRRNLSLAARLAEAGGAESREEPLAPPEGYRILRELGRGGMGRVLEAVQERTGRRVALKLLHRGAPGSRERERAFRREVHALARLRHPGLAAILDAGHGPDGRPFLVLELVEGRTLQRHLEEAAPPLAERVALLEAIARALSSAHQRGVIHRDLKPSNVLVDAEGRPKVLDFGLARLLEVEQEEEVPGSLRTRSTRIQGSLPYMSPEQVEGDPGGIDVRTDVHALGVLGYQMLLGRLPYEAPWRNLAAAAQVIARTPPTPPRSLDPRFPADLATILLKALEKERERRYGSAQELAEDLARYARGLPIAARPPSLAYQLSKLVLRHRIAAGLSAALFLGALGSAAALGHLYRRAERDREHAEGEQERAQREAARAQREQDNARRHLAQALARGEELESALEWLGGMIDAVDPLRARGADVRVLELLEESQLAVDRGELEGRPVVEAAVRRSLGSSWLGLGRPEAAERNLERALALRLAGDPPDLAAIAGLRWDLGRLRDFQARHEEAVALLRRALGDLAEIGLERDARALRIRGSLASSLRALERYDEARQVLAEALAEPAAAAPGELRAELIGELAHLEERVGAWDRAAMLFRQVLELRLESFGEEALRTALARHSLAGALARSGGERAEVRALHERAFPVIQERLPPGHPTLCSAYILAAGIRADAGRIPEALAYYDEALSGLLAVHGEDHPLVARVLHHLGLLQLTAGRTEEAERSIVRSREILERLVPDDHREISAVLLRLAALRSVQGLHDEALELTAEVRRRCGEDPGMLHVRVGADVFEARSRSGRGDHAAAAGLLADLIARLERAPISGSSDVAVLLHMRGTYLLAAGSHETAVECFERSHALRQASRGPFEDSTLETLESWTEAALKLRRTEAVSAEMERTLALAGLHPGGEARLRLALGRCRAQRGELERAEQDLLRAFELASALEPRPSTAARAATALAIFYRAQGDAAREARYQALAASPGSAPR